MKLLFLRPFLEAREALKDQPDRPAPKLDFGAAAATGERWITVHPHGDDGPGHAVLLKVDPHNPRMARVIGGAGGKLNYMKVHLKSQEEYRKQAAERAKIKRAKAAEARAASRGAGDDDAVKTRNQAIRGMEEDLQTQHGQAYERVARALGWTDLEPSEDDLAGLDDAAKAKAKREHAARLKKDVHAAVARARARLVEDPAALKDLGITQFSAAASPDRPAVEDLVGTDALRRGLGYAPERAELDDPEVTAERVRVLEGRIRDEKAAGNAQGAAVLAQRLAGHRAITADEIAQASPEALAGFARAAVGRLATLRDHAAVVGDGAPPPDVIEALGTLEADAPTIADALDRASTPSTGEALRETLRRAAEAGLLDPDAHGQREAALEDARFESVGAPLPDQLSADAIDALNEQQVLVLAAEAAKRARSAVHAPADVRRDAGQVPPAGGPRPGADDRQADIQDEIEKRRQADNLAEDGIAAPTMDAETQRDFLRRALDAGLIGQDAKTDEKRAKKARPPRPVDVSDPDLAARLVMADRAIRDIAKRRRSLRAAVRDGKEIEGIDADASPAWRSDRDGVLDLQHDAAATAPEVVEQVANDLRTMRARSFLDAVNEANDTFAEQSGFRADETHAELGRHIAFGAADALNEHAQTILGQPALDRQVIDTLGSAAAAQLVAWSVHQERPADADAIAEAVGEHHAKTQIDVADEAHRVGVEHAAKAHAIHGHIQTTQGDFRTLSALNEQRVHHYDEARKSMGRALGGLEATAALHEALARGKPPTEIRAAMGTQDAVSVAKAARALGLASEDFEVQTEGTNSWLKIRESGFSKLRRPGDPDGARLDADMLAIKRGDRDEVGWLPAGLTRRADPPARDVPPPKMHSEPFDYSLSKHNSIEEAMRTYVAQRAHDGMSAEAIHDDLMHGGHQTALTRAHDAAGQAATAPAAEPDMAEWEAENPEPDRHTFDMFDPDGPERAWQAWQQRRSAAMQAAGGAPADGAPNRLGKDEAVRQWGAAMESILPSRHVDEDAAARAKADAAALDAAGGDPQHPNAVALMKKHKVKTLDDLRGEIGRKTSGVQGRQLAQHLEDRVKAVADKHAAATGVVAETIHGQALDPEHGRDAVFRALAAHPAATAAFSEPHRLDEPQKRALRDALLRYHGVTDADRVARAADQAKLRDWHTKNPEPQKSAFNPILQEDAVTQEWEAWDHARRKVADEHGLAGGADSGITWEDYVHAHKGAAGAYRAVQDLVKSRFFAEVRAHHERLTGKPMKAGVASIEGWREHQFATSPEWRAAVASDREAAGNAARETNRSGATGQYGRGALTDKIEKTLEAKRAEQQQTVTLADAPPPVPTGTPAPKSHERVTLGRQVEQQAAAHVAELAPMIDPSKAFAARSSLRMDGDKISQQRAVKAWTRARKIGLFLGAGSGKTGVSLGALGELRKAGRAERGLFAVPSNVQGQFGSEALAFTEPGAMRWWAKPGAPKAERLAAYRDPGAHMVVVTHQALRDDVTDMVAEHLGVDRRKVVEGMTGFDADGNKAAGWTRDEMDRHVADALKKAGADKLLDFLAVDEGHTALNRQGKQDSHLARVVDSLGRLARHAGYMTGSPVKNDPSEVYDWLAKIAHDKYHDGPGGITRAAFMRRYGSDMPATKRALARELNRHTIMGQVDPGTTPQYHHEELQPTEQQAQRLAAIDEAYRRARAATRSSTVDLEALRQIAPHQFEGVPEEQHHERAQALSRPLTLAGARDAAYERVIHHDPEGAKLARLRDLAKGYKAAAYPRQGAESDDEYKARVARGDTTRRAGVVFARQLDAIPHIKAALARDGHEVIDVTGEMSTQEKDKRIEAYKAGKGHILLASDAIEAGSNLQRATWIAHYNVPQTFKGWDQRTARIDRLGQKFSDIDVHTLTIDHPSEHRRMRALERKEALQDAVMDGAAGLLDDSGLSREIRDQIARRAAAARPEEASARAG